MEKVFLVFIAVLTGLVLSSPVMSYQPFPDTGQTKCYNNTEEIACPQPGQPFDGQDAQYQPRIKRSYTKFKTGGVPWMALLDKPEDWIMTFDNVTGLTWELKTDAPGIRNVNNTYTWYVPNHSNPGVMNGGDCTGSACDTHNYIYELNAANFGGFSDWRIPSPNELLSLANAGKTDPSVDDWFLPTNSNNYYWTSVTSELNLSSAWNVGFYFGGNNVDDKSYKRHVRAVRGEKLQPSLVDNKDGTVTDKTSGLMWQKCSYPQIWTDSGCFNSPVARTWQEALNDAETSDWAGYTDWRLPNKNELFTLVDFTRFNPSISPLFESMGTWYWTSTTSPGSLGAWRVAFDNGMSSLKDKLDKNYVRPVRNVQETKDKKYVPSGMLLLLQE